ncbi:unnamed protein product, partial [Sphacelaria rigidula]
PAPQTQSSAAGAAGPAWTEDERDDDGDVVMASFVPSSPHLPLQDLRLSMDENLGSSSLLGLDDDDDDNNGHGLGLSGRGGGGFGVAVRGGSSSTVQGEGSGKTKRDRRSLNMALYSSAQW